MAPTIQRTALVLIIQITFKSMQHVVHIGKAGFFQGLTRIH